jgi:hypothetical protein
LVKALSVVLAALLALGIGEPSLGAHDPWSFRSRPAGCGPVKRP